MQYRRLGKSGLKLSVFSFGSWVTFGNQVSLSRKHVFDACHAALKRLQVDYLDLYFCHRPDITTPIEETVRAMHDLVSQGKVMYWGTSEWDARQITEAYQVARLHHLTPPTMEQPEYNLFTREKVERDFLPLYEEMGLGTTIWSPLASGVLTGKYSKGIPAESRFNVKGYEWLKQRYLTDEGRSRLEKVRSLDAIAREENLKALELLPKLTPDVMERIESVMQNRPEPPEDLTA